MDVVEIRREVYIYGMLMSVFACYVLEFATRFYQWDNFNMEYGGVKKLQFNLFPIFPIIVWIILYVLQVIYLRTNACERNRPKEMDGRM